MNLTTTESTGLYLVLISVHGLIRGRQLELGRDADTGGQTKYVVELARALALDPRVRQVDLVTRAIFDPKVSSDYSERFEPLSEKAQIVRLSCGPRRYLRKEVLWPYLDEFADGLFRHLRQVGSFPDIIHSHYADAGYVGSRLASWLGVPLIHTGHSLGRIKRQRLLDRGSNPQTIEEKFNFKMRIEAEELTLASADLTIASTHQEVNEQYRVYDSYQPHRMQVIPPGVDLSQFSPAPRGWLEPPIATEFERFLRNLEKPAILALSRPAPRKNLTLLLQAYGESEALQKLANLILILGTREDVSKMEASPRQVFGEIFFAIDRYDLYGKVAYPKYHESEKVADIYRWVARTRGVLINPALTEPFGLTLIEAAACGLPVVATADGGPRDILTNCQHGLLINPLDAQDIQRGLLSALTDEEQWQTWARNGPVAAQKYYSWSSHVEEYLAMIERLRSHFKSPPLITPDMAENSAQDLSPAPEAAPLPSHQLRDRLTALRTGDITPQARSPLLLVPSPIAPRERLLGAKWFLISDIDNTLLGDRTSLAALLERLKSMSPQVGLGIATGRHIESAVNILDEWNVPQPDVLITSVGSEIHYGPNLIPDTSWHQHINYRWHPQRVRSAMAELPGLILQPAENQRRFKISYTINDADLAPTYAQMMSHLRRRKLSVRGLFSHNKYLDLLPIRASKGDAVRYFALKWGLPLTNLLVAGDSGNDEPMLRGNTRAVVVGNYSPELEKLRDRQDIYFAEGHYAAGIIEAMELYRFGESRGFA